MSFNPDHGRYRIFIDGTPLVVKYDQQPANLDRNWPLPLYPDLLILLHRVSGISRE